MSDRGTTRSGCGQPAREINLQCQPASAIQNLALQVSSLSNGVKVSLYARPALRLFTQSSVATTSGSILRSVHQFRSSPVAWFSLWWIAQSGTVNSSLTLRPRPRFLGVADVMGVRGNAAADETRLVRDVAQMCLRTQPLDFAKLELALINFSSWVPRFLIT